MFKIHCNTTTTTTTKECGGLQVKAAWCCGLRLCLAAPSWRRPVSTPKTFGWSAAVPPMAWYGMVWYGVLCLPPPDPPAQACQQNRHWPGGSTGMLGSRYRQPCTLYIDLSLAPVYTINTIPPHSFLSVVFLSLIRGGGNCRR